MKSATIVTKTRDIKRVVRMSEDMGALPVEIVS